MLRPAETLADAVATLFERACREQDLAVAEHLLQALEVIARRDADDERFQQALLKFAQSLPKRS